MARRKPESHSSPAEEWVRFKAPSADASDCRDALLGALFNEEWSWRGMCPGCDQRYGGGLPHGKCERSCPKPVGGVELWSDKELVEMNGELGAVSVLTYFGDIEWSCEPGSPVAKHRKTKLLCPRCHAFDNWAMPQNDLTGRAKILAQKIYEGYTDDASLVEVLEELTDGGASDVLLSARLRALLGHLARNVGSGGRGVAVVVPSSLMCYILWRLLCALQSVWRGKPEKDATRDELEKRLLGRSKASRKPSAVRLPCVRYMPSHMKPQDLEKTASDLKGFRFPWW